MDCSIPGFPVLHHPPKLAQTYVHWVSDAIEPSHPLSSPSPAAFKSFPASGSFLMSWLFAAGAQSIGASALASVLPMNIQDWFPLGLIDLISLQSKGLSRVFSNTAVQKHQFFSTQPSLVQLSIPSLATGKTIVLTRRTFVGKVMSLLFKMLSRFVRCFNIHLDF